MSLKPIKCNNIKEVEQTIAFSTLLMALSIFVILSAMKLFGTKAFILNPIFDNFHYAPILSFLLAWIIVFIQYIPEYKRFN